MKPLLLLLPLLVLSLPHSLAQKTKAAYDKALADSLGADEYGMKKYFLVLLKSGPNDVKNKAERDKLFRGHMANIERLARTGKLVVAGPLGENAKQYRGIFILSVKTREAAESELQTDPAIREKLLTPEVYEWYGSAALPKYLEYHKRIERKKH